MILKECLVTTIPSQKQTNNKTKLIQEEAEKFATFDCFVFLFS